MATDLTHTPTPHTVDLSGLPEPTVTEILRIVREAREKQAAAGGYGSAMPPPVERLLDTEYHAECEADTSPVPTLEEVRAVLSKLPGSLAADFIAERDER